MWPFTARISDAVHLTHWLICAQAGLLRGVPWPLYVLRRVRHRSKLRGIEEAKEGDEPAWHGSSVEVDDLWPGAAPAREVSPRSMEL